MFKRIFSLLIFLFLASCSSSSQQNVVRINLAAEPTALDPGKARDPASSTLMRMFFEGLVRVGPEDKSQLALAKEVDVSEDGTTYTFHLRNSVWTTGEPVTADDFAYAWKRVLDPNFPADNAFQLYGIKNAKAAKKGEVSLDEVGIRAIDSLTLEVQLDYPIPYFLELLAHPIFFPVNRKTDASNPHWAEQAETYVSNGPFSLKQWKHNDEVIAEKNASYWEAEVVSLDKIQMVMVSADTELSMYQKKELDWVGSPISIFPLNAVKSFQERNELRSKLFLGTYFLRANTERPPFNHPLIRKAFAIAIDRQAIVDHVALGQIPAKALVPPALGLQEAPYFSDANPQLAREYLQEGLKAIGMTLEQLPEIVLSYAAGERSHLTAEALQEQWREVLGVQIKLESMERKIYFSRVSKEDYHLAIGAWTADFNDAVNFLEVFKFKATGSNNTKWENPRYAELLTLSSRTQDRAERLELLRESEALLMEEMPIIPIFHYTMLYAESESIRGAVVSSLGHVDFKWAKKGEKP